MPPRALDTSDFPIALSDWIAAIPADRGSVGWQAAAACLLESAVPKPGNVHPQASFPDLTHHDFVKAALAIAKPFNAWLACPAHDQGPQLGQAILHAVRASAAATQSNANLGMVLAIAPLAASAMPLEAHLPAVLAARTKADAAAIWEAIALAQPGGLGRVDQHDLAGPPPDDILEAMRCAADRDAIARLWTEDYIPLFAAEGCSHDGTAMGTGMVPLLEQALSAGLGLAAAIQLAFLQHLASHLDSLIVRRHGREVAQLVSREAGDLVSLPAGDRPTALASFDAMLRAGRWSDGCLRPINPGTTADLVATALFVLLRQGWTLPPSDLTN